MEAPRFEINYDNGGDVERMIIDLRGFYVHMMDFITDAIYEGPRTEVLCYFIDDTGKEYTSTLGFDSFDKSLRRCLIYFEKNEEFERCVLIKRMLNERL